MVMPVPTGRERPAAVLILLYDVDGEPVTLLTRRSQHVRGHRGEISLPGGAPEPDDESLLATALRECWEEIGVPPAAVTALGQLEPVLTVVTNFAITPFVARLHQMDFSPNPREVAELIELPLRRLVEPGALREELWERDGVPRTILFYSYGQHVIWGATARILHQFVASPLWPLAPPADAAG
ncbi:MAG: CoA pyrophosphatase [Chloroflexi bacterium]|nr:CoA pyrophosphatase [Chloroflexota bacterium]